MRSGHEGCGQCGQDTSSTFAKNEIHVPQEILYKVLKLEQQDKGTPQETR